MQIECSNLRSILGDLIINVVNLSGKGGAAHRNIGRKKEKTRLPGAAHRHIVPSFGGIFRCAAPPSLKLTTLDLIMGVLTVYLPCYLIGYRVAFLLLKDKKLC